MSVRKLKDGGNKPWLCECYPQGRKGKRVRKRFATKGEAAAFENFTMREVEDKPWLGEKTDHRRLSDILDLWFTLYGSTLNRGEDIYTFLSHIIEALGNPIATHLTANQWATFRSKRLSGEISFNTKIGRSFRPVSVASVNGELSRMKGVFNKLIELGEWHHPNPLDTLKALKQGDTEMGFLTLEQVEELLSHLKNSRTHPDMLNIVKLCLSTGARWSEAESLKGAQLSKYKVTFINTKTGKNRTVPISEELYDDIYKPTAGALFRPCYKNFMYQLKHRHAVDVPKGQASHILRHTFASHFMMNDGNILVLKDILGHSSIEMTMRYAHFAPEHLSEAVTKNPLTKLKKM